MTKLSLLMCSYNYGHYLPQALESILNQTIQPFEVIIIDDASQDNSVEVIKKYQKQSQFIRLYENPHNKGVVFTANLAIELSQGDYYVFCSADDILSPELCEKSLSLLQNYPEAGICLSRGCIFYDDNAEITFPYSVLLSKESSYLAPKKFLKRLKKRSFFLGGSGAVFHRQRSLEAGDLLPELESMCDWFLINTLAMRHGACFIPEVLYKTRVHVQAYSIKQKATASFDEKIFNRIIHVLDDKRYQDIKMHFIESGVVHQMGFGILPLLVKQKKFITLSLIWNYLLKAATKAINLYRLRKRSILIKKI